MRFAYRLTGTGWAVATLGDDQREIEMVASYLHDSLEQVARAVLALWEGRAESFAIFMDEPGEHRVLFRRQGDEAVAIEVRWHHDWASWGLSPEDQYESVFAFASTLTKLRGEILSALKRVWDEHGPRGYEEKWVKHPFPIDAYAKLRCAKAAIRSVPPPLS